MVSGVAGPDCPLPSTTSQTVTLSLSIVAVGALALAAKPVAKSAADLPSQLDPRGFLTFAVTGLALGLFGWLVLRTGALPKLVGQSGLASFVVLWIVYFGRLITVDPHKNVIRVAAVLSGLVLVPVFYLLIARSLLREEG